MTQIHGSAAGRLLDRDLPEGYLSETTDVVSAEKRTAETGTESILIFRIGLEWLALPTRIFQEITEPGSIHKLPHRVGGILRGLVNVRGEVLLCAALDVLLGSIKIRLQRNADTSRSAPRTTVKRERGIDVRRALHVDPDEVVARLPPLDQPIEVPFA